MFKVKFKNHEFTQKRFASPPLDLHWSNPTGQAGEACNLIRSAHDRLGYACEAYFGLLGQMDSSNHDSEQNRRALAQLLGVGLGQTMAQLLHMRRVFTLRYNLPAKSTSTAETLLKTAYQDNLFKVGCKEEPCLFGEDFVDKVMNPDQTMETSAPSILDELIRPLTEPAVQPVPEGFKSYVTTFIPKSQLDEMFARSPLSNQDFTQNRFASPLLDLHWNNPTGQAGEACNLIKSAHDRLGYACEAYFGLLEQLDNSNHDSEQNRRALAQLLGVGLGQTMAQLLHLRRVFTLRYNLPARSTSTAETLLKTAYQDNLFKVGCKEQPCLFGEDFADKLKPLLSTTHQQHQLQPVIRSVASGDKPQTIIIPQKRPFSKKWKQIVPFRFKKSDLSKEDVSQKIQLRAKELKVLVGDPSKEDTSREMNDPRTGHPKPPKLESHMNT